MRINRRSFVFAAGAAALTPSLGAQSQTDFLEDLSAHQDLRDRFPEYLRGLAAERLAERKRAIEALKTPADLAERRAYVRKTIEEAIGGFPEKTPLNPKVVGKIERPGYVVEKVVFESRPRFYVTANLYRPAQGDGPFPGVLYPLGHEQGGKSHHTWQKMLVTLARNGYVALAWDPAGQGERAQIYDEDFQRRKLIRSTTEHTVQGVQCLLAGDNFARYTIWDGIRALDYLLSRPEVDGSRIACTGNSGGGTHTSYISALEDRIHVAAPSCYLTGWGELLRTIGPQDAEQVLLPWIGAGLDHADFALAFAPRPFLILSAVRDFFSIRGARATYAEVSGVYDRLGEPDKISMHEADQGHGYHQPNRIAAYQWFNRWFGKEPYPGDEPPVDLAEFEELACTPAGRVVVSLGGETVHSLNLGRVRGFERNLPAVRARSDLSGFQAAVRERALRRAGLPNLNRTLSSETYGVIERSGCRIEKLLYRSEPGVPVPALYFEPASGARKAAVVYVHGRGKSAEAAPGGEIEWFVEQGSPVLALDPRGLGETNRVDPRNGSDFPRYFGDYDAAMTSFLLKKSLVGMRALDILAGVDWLEARGATGRGVALVGKEKAAVPALYAVAFDERIAQAAFENMLVSYEAVVERRVHQDVLESITVGALREYDLPDLVASAAPRPLRLIDPVDPLGVELFQQAARDAYAGPRSVYRAAGAGDRLQVLHRGLEEGADAVYTDFV